MQRRAPSVAVMDQRLNVITLGVDDVPRAKAFYERLGWKVAFTDGDIAMFQAGPMIVSLWSRTKLAEDSGVVPGDTVVAVGKTPVSTVEEFQKAVSTLGEEKGCIFTMKSANGLRYCIIRP